MLKKKVIVALSGGVDSAVATYILKNKNYKVSSGFIRGYNVDGCQDKEMEDARKVAQHLGVPFYVFDLGKEYEEKVVDYMLDGYRNGITPNPDVVCNSIIKFGLFYDKAIDMGFEFVASGHYSRIKNERISSNPFNKYFYRKETHIYEGVDDNKDQSYFLWQVPHKRFDKILFPVGDIKKKEVRKLAKISGVPVAEKKDSQGVCFLGKFDFGEFLREKIDSKKGDIIDINGKKVGEHDGVWFYTIGQRRGFVNTAGEPFYVIEKDSKNNILKVAYEDDKELYSDSVFIKNINFLDTLFKKKFNTGKKIDVLARIRYRQKLNKASVIKNSNGAILAFKNKDKLFPASGQSAVFYNNKGKMLGGGIIE